MFQIEIFHHQAIIQNKQQVSYNNNDNYNGITALQFILRFIVKFLWPGITHTSVCVTAMALASTVDLTHITVCLTDCLMVTQ
jgi:hypothetical protein